MRNFVSESNLFKAMGLATVLTIMSAGRLVQAAKPLGLFLPLTFVIMTFVSGAVTAWGRYAGMPGIMTNRRTLMRGAVFAVVLSLLALPVYVFWLDLPLRNTLLSMTRSPIAELSYPSTLTGCFSLVLWSAGFQTMFLEAAPMSLFARLTRRRSIAVALCAAMRTYIAYRQITEAGITNHLPLFIFPALVSTTAGCILFARFGLVPAMLLSAGLDIHVFFLVTAGR